MEKKVNVLYFKYDDFNRITYRHNHDPYETVKVFHNGEYKGIGLINYDSEDKQFIEINDGYFYLIDLIEE